MAASKTNKTKKLQSGKDNLRYASADVKIPARLGGGILKEPVEQEPSGKLCRYALAYINPAFSQEITVGYSDTTMHTGIRIGISWGRSPPSHT
jgi:hypothetical protein